MARIKVFLDKAAIIGGAPAILAGYAKASKYVDGKATDESDGYRVDVVKFACGMSMLTVKVATLDLDGMSTETIDQRNETGDFMRVDFSDDFAARPYVDRSGNLALTATASRVFLVGSPSGSKGKNGAIPGVMGGDNHA